MKVRNWSRVLGFTLLLVSTGACQSGPPAITDVKTGKDKEVTQAASTFDAREAIFAKAALNNAPKGGKVVARLAVVDVPGQQPGVIPGLETTLDMDGVMNVANLSFTAPDAGWPNGKYQLQVLLLDAAGAQKDQKNADFTTAGNQPAATPPVDAAAATTTDAPAEEAADAESTDSAEPQQ